MSWFLRPDRWPITPGDWLRVVDDLARAPTRALLEAFASVADALTGKDLTLRGDGSPLTLHLDAVTGDHSTPPIAMGVLRPGLEIEALEEVDLEASNVRWEGGRVDRLRVLARDVRLEAGMVYRLAAGPVELVGEVDEATVRELLAERGIDLEVTLDGTDQATVRVNRWITAEVTAELDGEEVVVTPLRIRLAGVTVPFATRFVEARRVVIPPLPRGLRITGISSEPGLVRATGVVAEFREPILLEKVLRAASTARSEVVLSWAPGATKRR